MSAVSQRIICKFLLRSFYCRVGAIPETEIPEGERVVKMTSLHVVFEVLADEAGPLINWDLLLFVSRMVKKSFRVCK